MQDCISWPKPGVGDKSVCWEGCVEERIRQSHQARPLRRISRICLVGEAGQGVREICASELVIVGSGRRLEVCYIVFSVSWMWDLG